MRLTLIPTETPFNATALVEESGGLVHATIFDVSNMYLTHIVLDARCKEDSVSTHVVKKFGVPIVALHVTTSSETEFIQVLYNQSIRAMCRRGDATINRFDSDTGAEVLAFNRSGWRKYYEQQAAAMPWVLDIDKLVDIDCYPVCIGVTPEITDRHAEMLDRLCDKLKGEKDIEVHSYHKLMADLSMIESDELETITSVFREKLDIPHMGALAAACIILHSCTPSNGEER